MTSPTPVTSRFVILRHDHPRGVHWDFMLESAGVLKTWALPQPPEPGSEQPARALGDHRIAYLDYEGPVSGDRGSVSRWDAGQCVWLLDSEHEIEVLLTGARLVAHVRLQHLATTGDAWQISVG
jgi:hypothetical protein